MRRRAQPPATTLVILVSTLLLITACGESRGADTRPLPSNDAVLAASPEATWIAEGQGRRIVYVFFDPNCPSCQLLYKNLRTFIGSHSLQLRWIPVAIVNVTSLGKAAAILQAPDPVAALR